MKVCLLAGGGLGNLVHTTCAIEAIKRLEDTDLTVWVGGEWPEQERFIDHDKVVVGEVPDLAGFDRVFRTPMALTGSAHRLAEKYASVAEPSCIQMGPQYTEVEANMWFARVLGYNGLTPPPKVRHATESPVDGDYIVVTPGTQRVSVVWTRKCYRHWSQVASKFFDNRIKVVFVGTQEDAEPWFDEHVNLCGKTSLWETSGVLFRSRAVVGVDNGITALSAAMGLPTVVLWGPTDEVKNRKFGPRVRNVKSPLKCSPCQHTEAFTQCLHANCMRAINPLVVVEAVLAVKEEGDE